MRGLSAPLPESHGQDLPQMLAGPGQMDWRSSERHLGAIAGLWRVGCVRGKGMTANDRRELRNFRHYMTYRANCEEMQLRDTCALR
jgi:hypothetical protein